MIVDSYEECVDGVAFIPDYRQNMELPEEEQIVVWLKPLSKAAADALSAQIVLEQTDRKGKKHKTNAHEILKKTLIKCVGKITNYSIRGFVSGKIQEIKTGADLYDFGDPELITEVQKAINDRGYMSEQLKKA